jgi:putative ABC transport system permease protein
MRTLRFLLKRFAAQRLLGLAIVVTLGFTIGVLVAGPIYADASREAILSSALRTAPVTVKNVRFSVYGGPEFDWARADAEIRAGTTNLPVAQTVQQARGEARFVGVDGTPLSLSLLFRAGAEEHLQRFRGEPPTGPGDVALPAGVARLLGLEIGDRVTAAGPTGKEQELRVTGTFDQPRQGDPFWYGTQSPFPSPDSTELPPALFDPEGYLALAEDVGLTSEFVWDEYLSFAGMTFEEAQQVPGLVVQDAEQLAAANPQLASGRVTSGLDTLLVLVRQRVADLRVPIFLVVFQVGAVALAVLAGVGALVLTRQSFELAVLRSRGFSRAKLVGGQTIQAVMSAAVAFPIGLLLGMGLAALASRSNGPSLPGVLFPIRLNEQAILLGIVGAAIGAAALVLLSLPHVRRTILEERRLLSREEQPLLARVPVEAFILPLALFTFVELRNSEVVSSIDRTSLDPLVLLTPTLLIFGLSFLALRLLLFVLRRLDRQVGKTKRLSTYLAARRLGRSPGTSFATALLLVLSFGLMVVSTSYRAIVLQNHEDTARQQVGSDWNVQVAAPAQPLAAIEGIPDNGTAVIRTEPTFEIPGSFPLTPAALGIDPATYEDGGWWRSDYSTTPESEWLAALRAPDPAVPMPGGPGDQLTVEVDPGPGSKGLELVATVQADGGDVRELVLGELGEDARFSAPLDGATELLSLTLRTPSTIAPDIAEVTISTIDGQAAASVLGDWEPLRWRGSEGELSTERDAATLRIRSGAGHVIGGFAPPMEPLPALVSPGVASSQGDQFQVTLGAQRLELQAIAVADHFPSVPGDFLVVSSPALLRAAARIPEAGLSLNEVWTAGDDPRVALRDAGFIIGGTQAAEPIEAVLAQLPQSLAVGMNFATAVGGLCLVVLGVAVGLYFAQRRREFEFAALRAMGTEPRQITRVLLLEQGVLIGFAIAVGAGLGFGVLAWLMPYVGRTLGAPFPAPVLVVDWAALLAALAAIVAATALGLLAALRALLRSSVTGVLRGEAE